jgi:hypothetical protein
MDISLMAPHPNGLYLFIYLFGMLDSWPAMKAFLVWVIASCCWGGFDGRGLTEGMKTGQVAASI